MRVYPRQKLYDIGHTPFLRAAATGRLNDGDEGGFVSAMTEFIGTDHTMIPLSRGRLGAYFAVKASVKGRRRKVLMSPFTIFDMVNMVICAGGEPVFLDSGPDDVHVTARAVADAVDDETAAVIVTHYHTSNREIVSIAETARSAGAALIEDCAISIGGRPLGRHVGTHGDFGIFSFGLFKFIASYFGGGLLVRDPVTAGQIQAEMADWPKMSARDLRPYFVKGIKLDTLTHPLMFKLFTFPVFRYGYTQDIAWIRAQAVNDPEPVLRPALPERYCRRPSDFQQREWTRQLPRIEDDRAKRLSTAAVYHDELMGSNALIMPSRPDQEADCFLNFPILVEDRDAVLAQLMRRGFDASQYYYRNCASLDAFSAYAGFVPNLEATVSRLLVLPCYPAIPHDYARALAETVREISG